MNEHQQSSLARMMNKKVIPQRFMWLVIVIICVAAAVIVWLRIPPQEVKLEQYERKVFSQHGEDGVLEKIFELVEPGPKYAVEFGAGDGVVDSNTRNLVLNHGWSALMIEGNPRLARAAVQTYKDMPQVKVSEDWIYPGNIELIFEDHKVPKDLDLLSIDIDSNDWYVWRAIHDFKPKVVLIEYNASFPPPKKVVVNYHPSNFWDGSDYYGASIQSLYELGKKKGYELLYCEKSANNLFFVREEYYKKFGIADNSPARLYRLPTFGWAGRAPNGLGWPAFDLYDKPPPDKPYNPFKKELVVDSYKIPKRFVYGR